MRPIDADALTEVLETMAKDKWNQQVGSSKGLEDAIDVIENAPTVEPERLQGELNEAIKTIKAVCSMHTVCNDCPMKSNCNDFPQEWKETKSGAE